MERTRFTEMECPIARGLEHVGEWWNILILRDAFYGMTRFDDFQKSLGIAPNTLTRRLRGLVDAGLLEKQQYNDRPPRFEYVLTQMGRDFRPVILSLLSWGNEHFAPDGQRVVLKNIATGATADLVLVDRLTGQVVSESEYAISPGPDASAALAAMLPGGDKARTEA